MTLNPANLGECPSGQASGVPYSPLYDDVYHPNWGAWKQTRYVFLAGNSLPERWAGRDRFVILETGFGLGNNFLATWSAWRADPQRAKRLVFISIEKHPLRREDLQQVHLAAPDTPDEPDRKVLAQQLVQRWPTLTPGFHTIEFEQGAGEQVTLMLGLGDVAELLPKVLAQVDAFYLDGFAPAKNPSMWDEHMLSRLGRIAAPGATAATWSVARTARDGLTRAGFVVDRLPGIGGKRDITRARYQPHHVPPPPPGGLIQSELPPERRRALIIGAGLAGCAAAWALSKQGWHCTLIDTNQDVAQSASGNPGGLFHAILHGEDGIHARAYRAAALRTASVAGPLVQSGQISGQMAGLIRLDGKTTTEDARALIARLGLPDDYVHWLTHEEASTAVGFQLPSGGWLFGHGGWLHPAGYARALLNMAQSQPGGVSCQFGRTIHEVSLSTDGSGDWVARDEQGAAMASAPVLVLASGTETAQLAAGLPGAAPLPMSSIRGQITALDAATPRLPVAGAGYVLALGTGRLLCGATTQSNDPEPAIREADHWHNLQQARRIGCPGLPSADAAEALPDLLEGRVGWRAATPDRLPYVGALPLAAPAVEAGQRPPRLDQPRFVPRLSAPQGGVYLMGGLGSRGITWAALAGELLASWVTGAPCPVESDLRDALDPARMVSRSVTRPRPGAEVQSS